MKAIESYSGIKDPKMDRRVAPQLPCSDAKFRRVAVSYSAGGIKEKAQF